MKEQFSRVTEEPADFSMQNGFHPFFFVMRMLLGSKIYNVQHSLADTGVNFVMYCNPLRMIQHGNMVDFSQEQPALLSHQIHMPIQLPLHLAINSTLRPGGVLLTQALISLCTAIHSG
jgi:hypothetical protein